MWRTCFCKQQPFKPCRLATLTRHERRSGCCSTSSICQTAHEQTRMRFWFCYGCYRLSGGLFWSHASLIIPITKGRGCMWRMRGGFVKPAWHLHLFHYLEYSCCEEKEEDEGLNQDVAWMFQRECDESPARYMCTVSHQRKQSITINALEMFLPQNPVEVELNQLAA